ncbi:MAG: def [Burkholderiales bacterium]|jgi:peptide deformylase|nr:def [Burkholderiales bacterium]
MAILEVLHFPDKRLHLIAKPILQINSEIKSLVADMAQTMYKENGIGLAATQVNVQKRIFIMDHSGNDEPENLLVFINPEILSRTGEVVSEEGCLSVPSVYEKVLRSEEIFCRFQDLDGKIHEARYNGLMSICFQHELDHLDGKVFVEYLSGLKQNFIKKKMKKIFKPI